MKRWLMVVVVVGMGACAFDADLDAPLQQQPVSDGIEYILVDPGQQLGIDDDQVAHPGDRAVPQPESEPCQCSTNECLQDWADKNFGCDLCVTLVCNAGPTHVCNVCDADTGGTDNGFNTNQP